MDYHLAPSELVLPRVQRIHYGEKVVDSHLPDIAAAMMQRPFLLSTGSLEANGLLADVQAVMGDALVGCFAGSKAHNPQEAVLAGADAARAAGAAAPAAQEQADAVDEAAATARAAAVAVLRRPRRRRPTAHARPRRPRRRRRRRDCRWRPGSRRARGR